MIRPMFDNDNFDECVQLLMNFQNWLTDTQEQLLTQLTQLTQSQIIATSVKG